jgi:hypothetical protein
LCWIYSLSRRARSVLPQVSVHVAHSITLGLSMYGLISRTAADCRTDDRISIAYVAIENIFSSELKSWRIASFSPSDFTAGLCGEGQGT